MKSAVLSLVVLTLNVSGPRRVHQGWPTRREAISARLKAEAPDVAAFQEVWRPSDREALASAAGHPYSAGDENLGLAVTSRSPIRSTAVRSLGAGWGALRARLLFAGKEVDVYSVRLEPGEGPAAARRLGQLFRLAEFAREQSATRPFVLLGDLGIAADERDSALLLDLLEARDLCVAHGDEVCGRTLGDKRVDYALIPYSSRPPKEPARAAFTDLVADDEEEAASLRFGLRAALDENVLRLRPAERPPGRPDALKEISVKIEGAIADAERRSAEIGRIPLVDAFRARAAREEIMSLHALTQEIRTALQRDERSSRD